MYTDVLESELAKWLEECEAAVLEETETIAALRGQIKEAVARREAARKMLKRLTPRKARRQAS